MTSHVKEPFQLVNPFSKFFAPGFALFAIILMNIVVFGFAAPFFISLPDTFAVLIGFGIVFTDLFLTLFLGVTIVNSFLRRAV